MNEAADIAGAVTGSPKRRSLFHFTRVRNLPAMANLDMLMSSSQISLLADGERRSKAITVDYQDFSMTLNAHLRIPDSMLDASTTQEKFRASIDMHVFLWPTLKACRKMIEAYSRREPEEDFAVLEFNAYSLITDNYSSVKLSKYDSGSAPRFPHRCSYKKSPKMFLPLKQFKIAVNRIVPVKASEIHEILIEERITSISRYLQAVYVDDGNNVPVAWRQLTRPLSELRDPVSERK